ncbi:glycoside hydrolase family 3 N-terminal domain-containing protein [Halopiger aswanensis]|uniref:Beta-glucosidase n=1 Tax=Halopiger aswanensis TaxID=148449 RepID=A0A3R7HGK5_9EURY|nr:glycoside hydrolase family 3 N-terminal domain-containing protein [Halopiger aswanensis]RKD89199.1 beta-glucosidase [Halopiger aswanensis]
MPDDTRPAYRDPSLSSARRTEELLERMTLEEKVAQLGSIPASELLSDGEFDHKQAEEILAEGTGQITRIGGEGNLSPRDAAEVANAAQAVLAETRLGIPATPHEECLSGYMGPGGTTFPQSIGLASTWSPDLVEEITTEIRKQLRAIGAVHALSPVLDLARDHRWGRTEETFGEDQYLVARMACVYVSGLQGDDHEAGISATLKHFVGHGAPSGGKNRASVSLGPRALREHLFPFEAAVKEGDAESVMNAYHDLDGVPCGSSRYLLTELLRKQWGFDGVVVADYGTVTKLRSEHEVAADDREAAIMALEAGIDVELSSIDAYEELVAAVEDGEIAEETVDESVRRVLRSKFRKGLFEADPVDPDAVDDVFETDGQRALARRAARESVTLLQDEADVLPLDPDAVESVAAIGPKADATEGLLGDYAYLAHFPELDDADAGIDIVSPLSALEDRFGADAVTHTPGCTLTGPSTDRIDEAVAAVDEADVAVALVGANSTIDFSDADDDRAHQPTISTSGEGRDVTDLGLPGVQEQLLEAVTETDTPTVAVVVSGKPHALTDVADAVPTIAHAWLPGEEGGAGIADVLVGDHNPSGRLPVSLPRDAGQLPINYNRNPNAVSGDYVYTPGDALFPFGHGESYTTFAYGDLELAADAVGPAGTIEASVTIENVGDRAGHEVVQWYSHARNPPLVRPVQQLRAFERVFLEPGERARVTVELGTSQLALLDETEELAVHPGEYELRVGRSAADIRATATVEIGGEKRLVPTIEKRFFGETRVE